MGKTGKIVVFFTFLIAIIFVLTLVDQYLGSATGGMGALVGILLYKYMFDKNDVSK